MAAQVAHFLSNQNQIARGAFVDAAFARHERGFHFRRRIIKVDRDETLPGRLLQIFQDRLIAGIVRNDQHEIRWSFENSAALFDRQPPSMIGEWVNDYDRIFAGFNDFVEIANRAVTYCCSKWSIVPDRLFAFDQETAD